MVEHAQVGEGHGHAVLVARRNDNVVLLAPSRLGHELDTVLGGLVVRGQAVRQAQYRYVQLD